MLEPKRENRTNEPDEFKKACDRCGAEHLLGKLYGKPGSNDLRLICKACVDSLSRRRQQRHNRQQRQWNRVIEAARAGEPFALCLSGASHMHFATVWQLDPLSIEWTSGPPTAKDKEDLASALARLAEEAGVTMTMTTAALDGGAIRPVAPPSLFRDDDLPF